MNKIAVKAIIEKAAPNKSITLQLIQKEKISCLLVSICIDKNFIKVTSSCTCENLPYVEINRICRIVKDVYKCRL